MNWVLRLSWSTLLLVVFPTFSCGQESNILPFFSLSTTGVRVEQVGHFDDGVSQAIHITEGFPFGNINHNILYIGTNGYFAFSEPFYGNTPEIFPGVTTDVASAYLVAPFWDDVDIRRRGNILYEVHSLTSTNGPSLLFEVNRFISPDGSFFGTWMVVVQWNMVHSWPDGESDAFRQFALDFYGIDTSLANTFQGILITNGTASYTVFTYRCDSMQWSLNGATIGYNAAGDYFENHPNTGSFVSHEIACLNSPGSEWFNVVYNISVDTPGTLAPPPTVEPAQLNYLEYLDFGSNYLERCRNCSSPPIPLGVPGLPFGSYYHETLYVGNNGLFSFGKPLLENSPAEFPTQQASTYYAYIVAPFWSDIDTRLNGSVRWQVYSPDVDGEDVLISRVEEFINIELGQDSITNANWMLVATWVGVHPFPHGNSVEEDRLDPYLQRENTFQGIIISNGTKVYAVFTYVCEDMEWSDAAVIGYNAGGEPYQNHPLSSGPESRVIGCVHRPSSDVNNVVMDLAPGVASGTTPEPFSTVGTCAAAGYTECCDFNVDSCVGSVPADCFCDALCVNFGDCCRDQPDICQTDIISAGNSSYLLYSDHFYIGRLSLDGQLFETLPLILLRGASVLDFDYMRGFLYWYDYIESGIFRSSLNGSNPVQLVNTSAFGTVEDIAVDWVSNKLYWTETLYRRIEVLDLETLVVAPVLDADPHSGIRGIAVDPTTRYMYWTDWGEPAKIERSSMDGADRTTLHSTGLGEPNGITIDYQTQTIYWTDSVLGVIDYSNTDGTNRRRLQSNLPYPYAITIEGSLVFFTDWIDVGVHATHKLDGDNVTKFVNAFTIRPAGIEVIASNRQAEATNFCLSSTCDHLCTLSSTDSRGFSCACMIGYSLDSNGISCTYTGTEAPPTQGTCNGSGYTECCSGGFCAGSPTTCFCDAACRSRDDCCGDIDTTCPARPTSCSAAGHDICCTGLQCAGVSDGASCYCDEGCRMFGDCCDDIDTTCPLPTMATTTEGPTLATTMAMVETTMHTTSMPLAETTMDTASTPPTETTVDITSTPPTETMVDTTSTPPTELCNSELPEPVRSINLTPIDASSLRVSWMRSLTDVPTCDDDAFIVTITGYSGGFELVRVSEEASLSITSQFLEKWIAYNVSVTARNALGISKPLMDTVFTEEGVPPIPPFHFDVKRTSPSEMTVSWDPLTIVEARGFITSYTVSYGPIPSTENATIRQTDSRNLEVPEDMSSVSIGNLKAATAYSVSVRGNTRAGAGVSSDVFILGTSTGTGTGTSVGAIAGGVVTTVLIIVLLSVFFIGVLITVSRKRIKNSVREYVQFSGDTDDVSINSNTTASVSLFVSNSTRNTEPEEPVQTMSYKQLNDEQNDSLAEPPRYHDIIESAPKFETVPMTLETVPMPNSDKL